MSARTRLPAALFLAAAGACLALAAWPWLRDQVVSPLALVAWLLLRLFVLSLDQRLPWLALCCAVPVAAWLALLPWLRAEEPPPAAGPAARAHPVEGWRRRVEEAAGEVRGRRTVGWEGFAALVVSLRALEQRLPADYQLHDALRSGALPLPPRVHAFLFPPGPPGPGGLRGRARRLCTWPARALRRASGRDRAERLQSVDELLAFLESSLEMSHDPRTPSTDR